MIVRFLRHINDAADRFIERFPQVFRLINAIHLAYFINSVGFLAIVLQWFMAILSFFIEKTIEAAGYDLKFSIYESPV